MKRATTIGTLAALAGLLLIGPAACDGGSPDGDGPGDLSSQIQSAITLEKFASCDGIETYLKDMAKEQIELQYQGMKSGECWGWGCGYYGDDMAVGAPAMGGGATAGGATKDGAEAPQEGGSGSSNTSGTGGEAGPSDPSSPTPAGDSSDYSTTNTQEAGVDEADFVKTDGKYIYVLRGSWLIIIDAVPAEQAHRVSATQVAGYPQEMFLQDGKVVIFSSVYAWDTMGKLGIEPSNIKSYGDLLQITILDVTDPAAPKTVRNTIAEASYVSSRLVNDTAHVVVRTNLTLPGLDYYGYAMSGGSGGVNVGTATTGSAPEPAGVLIEMDAGSSEPASDGGSSNGSTPSGAPDEDYKADEGSAPSSGAPAPPPDGAREPDGDMYYEPYEPYEPPTQEEIQKALDEAKADALAKVDAMTLEQLVPAAWELGDDGQPTGQAGLLTACEGFYRPTVEYGPNMVTIITINLSSPTTKQPNATIIGNGDTIYGSGEALYVASDLYNGWYSVYPDKMEDWQVTVIHKFDIASNPNEAGYVASGKVPGHVLNQFSMSEDQGHLRVATTKDVWDNSGNASESFVTVLGTNGGELAQLGQVGGLGKGEQIYSARFIGEKGYVVTYKQMDPLYTLDLSDPAAPKVMGELKIPGFSTYIHPFGDDHLLTIGRDTFDNGQWVEQNGVQLSIFDVSDLASPKQSHKTVIGTSGTHSDALYDHKAFNFFAAKGILAVPLQDWGYGGGVVGGTTGGSGAEPASDPVDPSGSEEVPDEKKPADEPSGSAGASAEPYPYESNMFAGAAVYDVSVDKGFSERGFIDHSSFMEAGSYYSYEQVSRTVIIGDSIYTIGTLGMKASRLSDLAEVATVTFPEDTGYYGGGKSMPGEAIPVDGGPSWDDEGGDDEMPNDVPPEG